MSTRRAPVRLLVEALAIMIAVEVAVTGLGLLTCQRLIRRAAGMLRSRRRSHPRVIREVVLSLEIISRRLPGRHECLSQALTGLLMLKRRQLPVTFHLGVGFPQEAAAATSLVAHAWISYRGQVITGGPLTGLSTLPALPERARSAR